MSYEEEKAKGKVTLKWKKKKSLRIIQNRRILITHIFYLSSDSLWIFITNMWLILYSLIFIALRWQNFNYRQHLDLNGIL